MRKFATALLIAGVSLIGLAPAVSASSDNHPVDLDNGYHLKTDICHNVDHNPVVVHVSVDSTDVPFDTGHGDLTLDPTTHGFISFVPHTGTGGHEHDFVLRVYVKHGNDEVNTYVSESKCESEETTTTTEAPTTTTTAPKVTTTTTVPVVTTTTQPPVVTTTTVPEVTTTTQPVRTGVPVTTAPPATDTPAPVAPVPAPTGDLPFTGSNSSLMAMIGAGLALIGISFKLLAKKAVKL